MPRILRNYLISFAIIGIILFVVDQLDQYFKEEHRKQQSTQQTLEMNNPEENLIQPTEK